MKPTNFTNQTQEQHEWLSTNIEGYEEILLHAMIHDPELRQKVMSLSPIHKLFSIEKHALLIGAIEIATTLGNLFGFEIPTPASSTFLKTHIKATAMEQEYGDDEIQETMQLIDELQSSELSDMHHIILPYFETWFGARRSKGSARDFSMNKVPDVRGIVEKLQDDLDAAAGLTLNLEKCKFDYNQQPDRPTPILILAGHTICTPGNLTTIQGPPKTAKTAVVEAIIAAAMAAGISACDTLGFTSASPGGRAILHFDTEQSAHDHDRLLRRSYKRAMRNEETPWLQSYLLTGMDPTSCWNLMSKTVKSAVKDHDGVMMILIDGVADFCKDPNDAGECFELVRKLHKLAIDYECVIISVIHENPGAGGGKTRGHLGSQLERKAETSLRLQKDDKTGVVEMWTARARSCFIPKSAGIRFRWSAEVNAHATLHASECEAVDPKERKLTKLAEEVTAIFVDADSLSYTEVVDKFTSVFEKAKSTAKSRIPEYVAHKLIEKGSDNNYRVVSPRPIAEPQHDSPVAQHDRLAG